MNSRQRLQLTLDHREPDRIPFDLGSTFTTGIHVTAYEALRRHLGLPLREPTRYFDLDQQLAVIEDDLLLRWKIDTQYVLPGSQEDGEDTIEQRPQGQYVRDDWGMGLLKPVDGFYFDVVDHPLEKLDNLAQLDAYPWPDPCAGDVHDSLPAQVRQARSTGRGVVLNGFCAGLSEMSAWLLGYERFYSAILLEETFISALLDRILDIKMSFWEKALSLVGADIDVVQESDDLGGQDRPLISPRLYRKMIKPRQQALMDLMHSKTRAKVFFHSCGAIQQLIPDLIEVGVDILNPVQVSAAGMDTAQLKQEYGKELTFWGGGVDTQVILGRGTPQQVREEVRRRIEDLAPGGGFVFSAVHNIQANVPPQNLVAMWEALQEFGSY